MDCPNGFSGEKNHKAGNRNNLSLTNHKYTSKQLKISEYLAGGEFLRSILFVFREDARVEHWRIRSLGAVLATKHPKRELRIVNHGSNNQFGLTKLLPMRPCSLNTRLSGQASTRPISRRRLAFLMFLLFGADVIIQVRVLWRTRGQS